MTIDQQDLDQLLALAKKCGIRLSIYKVKMNATYVKALEMLVDVALADSIDGGWFTLGQDKRGKVFQHDLNHMKYSKLRYWGLIEKGEGAGVWRVTTKGFKFLDGEVTVPEQVKELRAKAVWFSEKQINVDQARGAKFDYAAETTPC